MSLKIAVVGAGPAGCMAACNLNKDFEITLFDKQSPLKTLLPTGGGKCNLAHAEFDFKELVKNYPRGEKFLYSAFSRFGTAETISFFENIGVKTYIRDDKRIFPISNSSKDVRNKILDKLHHCKFQKEEIISIKKLSTGFELTSKKSKYYFDIVIISTGGKSGYKILQDLGHTISEPKPSLVGFKTTPCLKELQGVSIRNCKIICDKKEFIGDIIFTDNGISGPAIFELSSINARKEFPYNITIDFLNSDIDLQELFNNNPHKNLGNLLSEYLPKSLIHEIIKTNLNEKCHAIRSNTKELINMTLRNFVFEINGTRKDGEIVTCGGINLNEINPKTFESKKISSLYVCGEVLDADGLCGGYNLQLCWSSGYLCATDVNLKE
ncbi:aminoacetone oxidase family FAD-binding enzyme [bacterium]|nr:aminoacetone oxidase family FAD-binding enzyme [bacterium]